MNDDRNDTEYNCVTVPASQPTFTHIIDVSNPTILYVAGEYQYKYVAITTQLCYVYSGQCLV